MNPRLLAPTILGLLLACPAVSAAISSVGVQSEDAGLAIRSTDGQLVLTPGPWDGATLKMEAGAWDIKVVDEYFMAAVRDPKDPEDSLFSTGDRAVTNPPLSPNGSLLLESVLQEDAIAIVRPLSANYALDVKSHGSFSLRPVESVLLERSHFYTPGTALSPANAYEYVAENTLELNLTGKAKAIATGDFQVYFWGMALALEDDGSITQVSTGYRGTQVVEGVGPWAGVWEDHYVYSVVTALDASLSFVSDGDLTRVYGSSLAVESEGPAEFSEAQGEIAGQDGQYLVQGHTVVQDASFVGSRSEDGTLSITFDRVPTAVQGGSAVFQPSPLAQRPWFFPASGLGLVLLALTSAWLTPTVAGRRHKDPAFLGRRAIGHREHRAAAYFSWALAAEAAGHARRAAFWMGRAARMVPENPEVWRERGSLLRMVGKPVAALAAHARAHQWLQSVPDGEQAHNAYEAARAAALAGREADALDWLRLAVEADPYLAEDAATEPDFAAIRGAPDYQSLRGPERSNGVTA